ncbi:interferon gamma 1-like [Enoplosus armatus]|uniref:interferon gamma 1-like n=1 Tax=Enoplosus armatus TaxID=215367 RepID=UPI0039928DFC
MSPCCGSVSLLVLLGVVLAFGSPLHFISNNQRETHRSITAVLKLTRPEVGSNPLFTSVIRNINTSCQRKELQLMNVTLDIYMRIFSSILQGNSETPTLLASLTSTEKSKVENQVENLQRRMEDLKNELNRLNQDREDALSKLKKIEVDDPEVQRKALAEYMEVYQAASVVSHSCGLSRSAVAK